MYLDTSKGDVSKNHEPFFGLLLFKPNLTLVQKFHHNGGET